MSLLHNAGGWLTREGEPVVGITPPSVLMRAGVMTAARRNLVQAAYARFLQARKTSLSGGGTGGGFFVANYRLADGTTVRAISINGVDHVHVWASDAPALPGVDFTFWCQPWDDEWITDQYAEVFTIPRWFDISAPPNDLTDEDFLQDLARNKGYEPPAGGRYPGNQTWFAPPGHPAQGFVVSWWGQMRRYSNSLLDQTIDIAGTWRRPPRPTASLIGTLNEAAFVAPTGGIAGALDGHLFHKPGTTTLPAGLTETPRYGTPPGGPQLWVNGVPFQTPAGFVVSSACIGIRGGIKVVRAVRISGGTITIIERGMDVGGPWTTIGNLNIFPTDIGLPHPIVVAGASGSGSNTGAGWRIGVLRAHPFYWNADGTEALGLFRYTKDASSAGTAAGVYALLKITVGASACTMTLVDHSKETVSGAATAFSNTTGGGPLEDSSGSHSANTTITSEYYGIVAADFRGNDPVVMRTHIEWELTRSEGASVDRVYTSEPFYYNDQYGNSSFVIERTASFTAADDVQEGTTINTWASLNLSRIADTTEQRVSNFSALYNEDESSATAAVANPEAGPGSSAPEYLVETVEDSRSVSTSHSFYAAGAASLWGLSAGDLRGEFVIHAQPLDGSSDVFEAQMDSTYNYNLSFNYSLQSPVTGGALATFSKTITAGIGKMLRVAVDGTTTVITNLIHPTKINEVGSGTQAWSAVGSEGAATSVGTYGDGPSWTSFMMPAARSSWGSMNTTSITTNTRSRNYAGWVYPDNAPDSFPQGLEYRAVSGWTDGGAAGAGGYANTVLVGGAITPDMRVQYTGALFVAMVAPSAPTTPVTFTIDRWAAAGVEFVPEYPDQEGSVFPHRGDHALLLNPIFAGPLP
jgi:hypothetical protein